MPSSRAARRSSTPRTTRGSQPTLSSPSRTTSSSTSSPSPATTRPPSSSSTTSSSRPRVSRVRSDQGRASEEGGRSEAQTYSSRVGCTSTYKNEIHDRVRVHEIGAATLGCARVCSLRGSASNEAVHIQHPNITIASS